MHEVAAVSALVEALLEAAAPHTPYRPDRVRVQLGSAFSEDALYQAFEMLTTGQFVSAARAAELGLVNRAVPADRLEEECRSLAATIAAKQAAPVRIGKRAFYDQIALPLTEAYDLTGRVMVENMLWRETDEGIAAFLDKRGTRG